MEIEKRQLIINQLDKKIISYKRLESSGLPHKGWLYAIRTVLNMSLKQLASRMKITPAAVKAMENREIHGAITINTLREAAAAMNMKLVYGFIPNDESLEKIIESRARKIATEIVERTSHTMKLEDQENSKERILRAIDEKTKEIKNKMPRYLWD